MAEQTRKLSDIMKEMAQLLLRDPKKVPSVEAAHVALFFANVAWNETIGLDHPRANHRSVWGAIEAEKPDLWDEFESNDVDAMIDRLVRYKQAHYAHDRRRILVCGMIDGKVRVEWLRPAAPGTDPKLETRLYGLLLMGDREGALRILREECKLTRRDAASRVDRMAAELGVG